jgi:hypothetical protein
VAIRTIRVEISFMTPGRPGRVGVNVHFPGDQLPVPSPDRVGGHDGRDLPQDPAIESATFRGEASALIVGQPGAPPRQLASEDPVLLHEVLDHVLLMAVDPAREGHEQHLQAGDIGRHGPIVPCLIPDPVTGSGPAEFSDISNPDYS